MLQFGVNAVPPPLPPEHTALERREAEDGGDRHRNIAVKSCESKPPFRGVCEFAHTRERGGGGGIVPLSPDSAR